MFSCDDDDINYVHKKTYLLSKPNILINVANFTKMSGLFFGKSFHVLLWTRSL